MKKDDLIELTIEDLGVDGEGIGKVDGMAIFVKDVVPGDRVQAKVMKMKKSYGYARLMQVLDPSPERTEPRWHSLQPAWVAVPAQELHPSSQSSPKAWVS